METYLVYHSCKFTGVAIIGNYCNKKAAIRASMRKVYQLMNIDAKKVENEWTWFDEHSCISIMELPISDIKDLRGDSPIPQFMRYKEFIEEIPMEDLERLKSQALNRKRIMERVKKNKKGRLNLPLSYYFFVGFRCFLVRLPTAVATDLVPTRTFLEISFGV
ncbi:hypothetical protein N9948_01920 [bacterium]|nr:hypothetical protein [bacterium]